MDKKDIKQLLDQQSKGLREYVDDSLSKQTKGLQNYVEERLTKQTKELHGDYDRQGKFLLDEFQHQASIIAEQHTDLKKDFKNLNKKVDKIDSKLDATFEMVGKNTVDIEIIKQAI